MGGLIAEWCRDSLGSAPAQTLFETGHLSTVTGVRLEDGRRVVLKVRPWHDRLVACGRVQRGLFELGFAAPELFAGPDRIDGDAVSAEAFVEGSGQLGTHPHAAALFATGLQRLIALASRLGQVGSLEPSPPWVGWDHLRTELWPAPDDREGDINSLRPGDWIDQLGRKARKRLAAFHAERVVGHGDWYSQNLHWSGDALRAVHDWDSVVLQPEAAIAGQAAAVWPATGGPGETASIDQTQAFIDAYADARGRPWSDDELEAAWASGLWNRAFDAKKACLSGEDPDLVLTRAEGMERAARAGLA